MQVRGKSDVFIRSEWRSLKHRQSCNRRDRSGDRPHTVKYYVHFPFSILNFSFQTAYDHCKFHQNVVLLMYHRTGERYHENFAHYTPRRTGFICLRSLHRMRAA